MEFSSCIEIKLPWRKQKETGKPQTKSIPLQRFHYSPKWFSPTKDKWNFQSKKSRGWVEGRPSGGNTIYNSGKPQSVNHEGKAEGLGEQILETWYSNHGSSRRRKSHGWKRLQWNYYWQKVSLNEEKRKKKRLESERTPWTVKTDIKRHKEQHTHILVKFMTSKGDG